MLSNPDLTNPLRADDFNSEVFPTWCPGCGDFAIWAALKNALVKLNLAPHQTVLVFGIGCSGNFASFVKANIFHSLHGRALPAAVGAKLANHELNVIVIGGDGDGFAEGLSHTIQTIRSNVNLTYIVHDNHVYSLTVGQSSPTSMKGFKGKAHPDGYNEFQLNPTALAVSAGGTFVARGFAGDIPHLTDLIVKGVWHRGFSFIDVMQPCPTFNPEMSYDWYRKRVYKLEDKGYAPDNRFKAWEVTQEPLDQKIAVGILYEEDRLILEDNYPQISKTPLVKHDLSKLDISSLLEKYQ
ncbi:MAG: 2-oxoacid:ferredoxin oxidoreductase subunit beta [Candidatus Doudnabacteria bacterium]|nr:2-oxoacid:ferredoxin oxidoreductase subunit beta [Candidatus Doudnabacteria bacterium]